MYFAIEGHEPFDSDYHDPNITDRYGHTVEYYLELNDRWVPI